MLRRTLIMSAFLLMISVGEAAAVCQTSDLQGRWRYSALLAVNDPAGLQGVVLAIVVNCRFFINRNGIIFLASCFEGDFGPDFRQDFVSQQIIIERNCHFKLTTNFFENIGQLSIDKTTGAGTVRGNGLGIDRASFNLVKE